MPIELSPTNLGIQDCRALHAYSHIVIKLIVHSFIHSSFSCSIIIIYFLFFNISDATVWKFDGRFGFPFYSTQNSDFGL